MVKTSRNGKPDEKVDFDFILTLMKIRYQEDRDADFHSLLPSPLKNRKVQQLGGNFFDIVFIALMEMMNSTVIENGKRKRNNTFIIRCKYCGRHFVQKRSNSQYCERIVDKYKKKCCEVGPKLLSEENKTLAKIVRHRIVNRINSRLKRAEVSVIRSKEVMECKLKWLTSEAEYAKQLFAGEITEDQYCRMIEDAFKEIFDKSA